MKMPDFPFSQVVQADVGYDTVEPGVKTAVEAEGVEVLVNSQKGFLVNVPGVFGRPQKVHGDP